MKLLTNNNFCVTIYLINIDERVEMSYLRKTMYNKDELTHSEKCGCMYCGTIFNPNEITKWTDENNTAICPYCGVDSVIADSDDINLNPEFLKKLHKEYFRGINNE